MKKIIAFTLSLLMLSLCFASCEESQVEESSSAAESSESNVDSSANESNAASSDGVDISDAFSEISDTTIDELNIIYYKFEIPYFVSAVPEKGASCVDYDGKGIDEYLLERDDASDDVYFAVGLLTSEGATLEALTEMGFIKAPKAVKSISWKTGALGDLATCTLDYVGYINPSGYDALCKNEAFGVEIIWLNTSVIKYGSAIVCDVESLENIRYYEGEYTAAADMYVNTSGVREIYSSSFDGIEKYLSENEIAEDVYFAVGISINGSYDGRNWAGFAEDLPQMFGFVKDANAKLSLEIVEEGEKFTVPFDVVGYVNKSAFEKMQNYDESIVNFEGFGIEMTWLKEEYFE